MDKELEQKAYKQGLEWRVGFLVAMAARFQAPQIVKNFRAVKELRGLQGGQ